MAKNGKREKKSAKNRDKKNDLRAVPKNPAHRELVDILPIDSKGWMVLELAPRSINEAPQVLKLEITTSDGIVKVISLVRQLATLRVHVNPDPKGADEWVMNDQMFQVICDPEPQSQSSSSSSSNATGEGKEHLQTEHE